MLRSTTSAGARVAAARGCTAAAPVASARATAAMAAAASSASAAAAAAAAVRPAAVAAAASAAVSAKAAAASRGLSVAVEAPPLLDLPDEAALREAVARFAKEVVAPDVRKMDTEGGMTESVRNGLFENGLMGIEVPEEFGGAGMSFSSSIVAIEELAKVDAGVSVVCDVQNTLIINAFRNWATDEQKAEYLPRLATDTVASFCLSEAGSGSDAFAMASSAQKVGDEYVINGEKLWITNANEAGVFLVTANVDFDLGYKGITAFVVDRNNPGVTIGKKEDKLGIRSSSTCPVTFTDCRVPASAVMGGVGNGYKIAIGTLNEGRIGIAAQMLGLAEGALKETLPYIHERKQFGRPIAEFQGMQFQFARAALDIEAARLLVYNAARLKEANKPFLKEAAMAKLYASECAERTASICINMLGGVGFTNEMPLAQKFRDCKIGQIYEGTSNVQLVTIAKILSREYQ